MAIFLILEYMKFSWGGFFLFFELGLKRSISQNKKKCKKLVDCPTEKLQVYTFSTFSLFT